MTQMLMSMMPASSYKTPEKRAAGLRKGLDDASSALPHVSPGHIKCVLIQNVLYLYMHPYRSRRRRCRMSRQAAHSQKYFP